MENASASLTYQFCEVFVYAVGITAKGTVGNGKGLPVRTSLSYAEALAAMQALNDQLPRHLIAYLCPWHD